MVLKINTPKDKEGVISYISRLPDKQFIVAINKRKEVRTLSQNRLYQLWIAVICDEIGYNPEELKLIFRGMFLPKETFVFGGVTYEIAMSTTKLDTVQFTAYLNKIEVFASAELGIILPRPEDLHFAEMYDKYQYAI